MREDTRAVSIAITHGLTIAITAVLISGLLIGAGNLLQDQEERVAEEQFDEIGSDMIGQIQTLDTLNETGEDVTVRVQPRYPERVAGYTWNIEIAGPNQHPFDTAYALNITSLGFDRTLQYPLNTKTTVDDDASPANSDQPVILLCDGDRITFTEC